VGSRNNGKLRRRRNWQGRIVFGLRQDIPLALLDTLVITASYTLALVVRFEGSVPRAYWMRYWRFLAVPVVVHLGMNYLFGVYGHMWQYASIREARNVVLAGITAVALVLGISEFAVTEQPDRLLPLSVAFLGAVTSVLGFGAIRFQSRLFAFHRRSALEPPTRILVMGAGEGGAKVLRDIQRHPHALGLEPVAIVDDDPRKVGRALFGVRVLGTRQAIPRLVSDLKVDQVLLTIPSATSDLVREVVALCEDAGVGVRVLPSVREMVNSNVTARDIRDLRIEDLLGRQMVQTDLEAVARTLAGRRILVTGAGGSIGSEIVRQLRDFEPSRLILLDHDEIHLHEAMLTLGTDANVDYALGDVRDRQRVFGIFERFRPEIVFHAAAHKHLPMLEAHPGEAVRTNVLGTTNVADAALAWGAERLVFISTDKAVKPTSVMGASKWLAEQVIWSRQESGCAFTAVRFGNVVGSRGGVIQTFLEQVALGGPVTVTDPGMHRYFMSLKEAVQLVLQAVTMARGGEVFTLEMGDPVSILELARRIIRLAGRVPEHDIGIEFVGKRAGEKLVEDLLDLVESPARSSHPAIIVSHPPLLERSALEGIVEELAMLAAKDRDDEVALRMKAVATEDLSPSRVSERVVE
jgi:FlaA1/EpsC-like NDP-sugar epimerase